MFIFYFFRLAFFFLIRSNGDNCKNKHFTINLVDKHLPSQKTFTLLHHAYHIHSSPHLYSLPAPPPPSLIFPLSATLHESTVLLPSFLSLPLPPYHPPPSDDGGRVKCGHTLANIGHLSDIIPNISHFLLLLFF